VKTTQSRREAPSEHHVHRQGHRPRSPSPQSTNAAGRATLPRRWNCRQTLPAHNRAAVGGLADTVADRDDAWDLPEQRTGYIFQRADHQSIESALARAIGLWHAYPQDFRYLMLNGMRSDRSWARPGQDYLSTYDNIEDK
jgi:hypothetical protein